MTPRWRRCRFCGQPMKPKGVKKRSGEYDHARGCPYSRVRIGIVPGSVREYVNGRWVKP